MGSQLENATKLAKVREALDNKPRYVVRVTGMGKSFYAVMERMPMFGEWYTSDGTQHGC